MQASVEAVTAPLGITARLHARALDAEVEAGHLADEPVVMASTFKVPVLLELCRQATAGRLDLTERVRVVERTVGSTGISAMLDAVELSLRDLAQLMIAVSDNTATDVVLRMVGLEATNAMLAELGLERTRLVGDCRDILNEMAQAMGAPSSDELEAHLAGLAPEERATARGRVRGSAVADPARTSSTTPREATRLLGFIWSDEAAPPEACAEVRRILATQVWPHRLRSGFGDDVAVAGKTGTLPHWRGEIGVVTYPDGARFAVAVYLESERGDLSDPDADRAIGRLARLAVDRLRGV